MSNPTLHEQLQRFDAYLRMKVEEGATAPGEDPPVEHIRALFDAPLGRANEVQSAHAERRGPPDFSNAPDHAGPPDDAQGGGR